ncbi:photosynthetic complex putative assembly protein PuhB [Tardiphaga sp.]|uniref:photosynthetic complex putative assembly protein PuhB n=1 Tax=Tardiphaga sp. TaxID=1926292 RepID=UPI0025DAEB9F|nr:photosynthetic complex putative assembly protein PuhB [Tardiphaga sp.]
MKHEISQFKLPAALPEGERLIWQGKPGAKGLAWRAFHVRELPLYFGAFLAWRLWSLHAGGAAIADYAWATLATLGPALISAAVLTGLAWLFARAATYTITSRRVLLQFGVALPMTMNIPLGKIESAALKTYSDGSGEIPLKLVGERVSHLLLWPHVRPWKLIESQPMLRAVPDAAIVAARLNEALTGQPGPQIMAVSTVRSAVPEDLSSAAGAAA